MNQTDMNQVFQQAYTELLDERLERADFSDALVDGIIMLSSKVLPNLKKPKIKHREDIPAKVKNNLVKESAVSSRNYAWGLPSILATTNHAAIIQDLTQRGYLARTYYERTTDEKHEEKGVIFYDHNLEPVALFVSQRVDPLYIYIGRGETYFDGKNWISDAIFDGKKWIYHEGKSPDEKAEQAQFRKHLASLRRPERVAANLAKIFPNETVRNAFLDLFKDRIDGAPRGSKVANAIAYFAALVAEGDTAGALSPNKDGEATRALLGLVFGVLPAPIRYEHQQVTGRYLSKYTNLSTHIGAHLNLDTEPGLENWPRWFSLSTIEQSPWLTLALLKQTDKARKLVNEENEKFEAYRDERRKSND